MTAHREINVAEWVEPSRPPVVEKRARMRFLPPALIGVLGTLILHTLALETVYLGGRTHKLHLPEVVEPASANNHSAASPAESLVFIDLPQITTTDRRVEEALASLRASMKEKPIRVSLPDPSPPAEVEVLALSDDKPSESSGSGDGADRARLFGIYTGQIKARIERIWRRPRTPVNDASGDQPASASGESFQCQVQIVQDKSGNVLEILLPNCNGSVLWQHSLVMAIQQASPLPAPPSESVFSHSITLDFLGLPYVAGSPEDDYEISRVETAQISVPSKSPEQVAQEFLPFRPNSQDTAR